MPERIMPGATVTSDAHAFAENLAPVLQDIRAHGSRTQRAIVSALITRGIRTRQGEQWHVSNERNLLERTRMQQF